MGRPRIQIDKEAFEKLCGLHCTLEELTFFFDCSEDTIERWCKREYKKSFAEVLKIKSGAGNISLRRKQFQVAEAGNVSMLIWLGKQWLGQTETQAITISTNDDETIKEMEKYFEGSKKRST